MCAGAPVQCRDDEVYLDDALIWNFDNYFAYFRTIQFFQEVKMDSVQYIIGLYYFSFFYFATSNKSSLLSSNYARCFQCKVKRQVSFVR